MLGSSFGLGCRNRGLRLIRTQISCNLVRLAAPVAIRRKSTTVRYYMSFKPKEVSIEFKGTQKRSLRVYEGTVMAVDTKTSMRNVERTTYTHVPGSFVPKVGLENNVYASQSTEVWLQDDQGNEVLLEPAPKLKLREGHRIRVAKAFPSASGAGWAVQHNLTTGERIERTDSVYLTEKDEKQVKGVGPAIKAFLIALVFALLALLPTYSVLVKPLGLTWEEQASKADQKRLCAEVLKSSPKVHCVAMTQKKAPAAVQAAAAAAMALALFLAVFVPLSAVLRKRHTLRDGIARHYEGIVEQVNPKLREVIAAI